MVTAQVLSSARAAVVMVLMAGTWTVGNDNVSNNENLHVHILLMILMILII